jgi:subtilisin family serine protease/subtilisin-like proprotein convertase family protein
MSRRTRRRPLRALRLESRDLPSFTPVGPLARPYTFTEVMAGVRAADPLAALRDLAAGDAAAGGAIDPAGSRVLFRDGGTALVQVRLRAAADPLVAVDRLRARPDVAWASPNFVYVGDPRELTPNDPLYNPSPPGPLGAQKVYYDAMQMALAWDKQTGTPNVIVAVADDGLAVAHPDLVFRTWFNPGESDDPPFPVNNKGTNGIDDDGNGIIDDVHGATFIASPVSGNVLPAGDDSHGTRVAGVIAAQTNNAIGIAGVAGGGGPSQAGARVMALRWYDSANPNLWTSSVVAQSYAYAIANGAKVINSSYDFDQWAVGGVADPTVNAALDLGYAQGVLFVHSAGNEARTDPARGVFDQTLFVAATESNDLLWDLSNRGEFVDIAAPGVAVISTSSTGNGTVHTYAAEVTGTSLAAPHVAGVAALVWSQNPTWTRDQVVAQLTGTADALDVLNPDFAGGMGAGRVNAFRAVASKLPAPRLGAVRGLGRADNDVIAFMPERFTIDAPMRFDPATVQPNHFRLYEAGPDGKYDTGDDVEIPLVFNGGRAYRMGTAVLGFEPAGGRSLTPGRYRFRASAADLRDPFGVPLDGDGDGNAGDDFVRSFLVSHQIDGTVYEDRDGDGAFDRHVDFNPAAAYAEPTLAERVVFLEVAGTGNGQYDAPTPYPVPLASVPVPIPDEQTITSKLTVSGFVGGVVGVAVNLRITHTFTNDLVVSLTDPGGTTVKLIENAGGFGADFGTGEYVSDTDPSLNTVQYTVLDDAANVRIVDGFAPFVGRYRPKEALAAFEGVDPNGAWTLTVADTRPFDFGTLDHWSLTITSPADERITRTDVNGAYAFLNLPFPQSYDVYVERPTGWNAGAGPAFGKHTVHVDGLFDTNRNTDFGQLRADTVYGRIYNDVNHSKTFDEGDVPLPNWVAFRDLPDGQGQFDGDFYSNTTTKAWTFDDNNKVDGVTKTSAAIKLADFKGRIADLNVKVSFIHPYVSDLEVYLVGPGSVTVPLFFGVGGDGDNMIDTVLDDAAATSIFEGKAPFTGSFRPAQPLSVFNDISPNGPDNKGFDWTLLVFDTVPATDAGYLTGFELEVTTTEPMAKTDANGTYALSVPDPNTSLRRVGRVVPDPAYTTTTTPDPLPAPPAQNFGHELSLGAGQSETGRDFGMAKTLTPPLPTVVSVAVDDGTAQRSRVRSLRVRFSEPVTPAAGAFQLLRTGPGGPTGAIPLTPLVLGATVTLNFGPGGPVGLELGGSLRDGVYELTVNGDKVTGNGSKLQVDGDLDGKAGGSLVTPTAPGSPGRIFRLFGDSDGDADVDAANFGAFRGAFGNASNLAFDYEGDGDVDAQDFGQFRARFGSSV